MRRTRRPALALHGADMTILGGLISLDAADLPARRVPLRGTA
jgi:hypothetical protein